MNVDVAQLTSVQLWLPVLISIAAGLLLTGLASRFHGTPRRLLLRRGLRMAGVLLITYGLILAILRFVALDLTTLSRSLGQLLIIGLGAYLLWEGLELILSVSSSELQERTSDLDAQARVETLTTLIRWTGGVIIMIISLAMALSVLNIDITPLIASAGIAGLAISLGAQKLVQDLIAGILIIVEDQYRVGDVVDLAGKTGAVEHISLRATHLRDISGTLHIVPHSNITTVSNLTSSWSRAIVDVGVSYGSDLEDVIATMKNVGARLFEEDDAKQYFVEEPSVSGPGPESFGDSSIVVRLMARVHPGKQWDAQRLMRWRIKQAFDEAGINIPFPQRDLHIHTDSPGSGSALDLEESYKES